MSYPLKQNPVPLWALPEQRPVQIDTDAIPAFLLSGVDDGPVGSPLSHGNNSGSNLPGVHRSKSESAERPRFFRAVGRWSSVVLTQIEEPPPHLAGVQDVSILDKYDLQGEWQSKLDDTFQRPPEPKLWARMKEDFIKNLAANPFYPMLLRGSASAFLIIALALSCSVLVQTNNAKHHAQALGQVLTAPAGPAASTIFCIVVCSVSLVYMMVSLWDETFGRPLGLRPTQTKLHFVAADLCLICFTSSNLSLCFDSLTTKKYICPGAGGSHVCRLQKTCTAFVFLSLVVWFLTFLVSTFRMIDRASH